MQGRRLPDATWPHCLSGEGDGTLDVDEFRDGDYWKLHGRPGFDEPTWMLYYHGAAGIPLHFVDEHDDGTISVLPQANEDSMNSIAISDGSGEIFHGYIRRGVWGP